MKILNKGNPNSKKKKKKTGEASSNYNQEN